MIIPFCSLPSLCPYLKDRDSRMEYRYVDACSFELNDNLARHGFRRFGKYFSKPTCQDCKECINIRIDVENFHFSKSAKRTIKKNENTRVALSQPTVNDEHLRLYHKYHKFMHQKRDWKYHHLDFRRYYDLYVAGRGEFGKEISYYANGQLIGVDLVDILSDGLSAVYCYYDPDYAHLSIGRYSIYQEIYIARQFGLKWIYLGYYVKECPSLAYKDEYRPYQKLLEYVDLDITPVWGDTQK